MRLENRQTKKKKHTSRQKTPSIFDTIKRLWRNAQHESYRFFNCSKLLSTSKVWCGVWQNLRGNGQRRLQKGYRKPNFPILLQIKRHPRCARGKTCAANGWSTADGWSIPLSLYRTDRFSNKQKCKTETSFRLACVFRLRFIFLHPFNPETGTGKGQNWCWWGYSLAKREPARLWRHPSRSVRSLSVWLDLVSCSLPTEAAATFAFADVVRWCVYLRPQFAPYLPPVLFTQDGVNDNLFPRCVCVCVWLWSIACAFVSFFSGEELFLFTPFFPSRTSL